MDFTLKKYKELLNSLKDAGYSFQTFADFLENPTEKSIVLRHDVDAKKMNSLRLARIQAESEIKGTYYFRMVPWSYDREVIREIAARGHEIGYHYETMDTANGDWEKAYDEFCQNLEKLRETVPIKTICMHGSPLSKYDNRSLWEKYDYKELGIIGEPYFDIDFNKVLYLTDTGRRWDGEKVSVRDKVKTEDRTTKNEDRATKTEDRATKTEDRATKNEDRTTKTEDRATKTEQGTKPAHHIPHTTYHSTNDIIKAAKAGQLPNQIMLTFHPQRWTNRPLPWIKELIWQNIKNQIKRLIVR